MYKGENLHRLPEFIIDAPEELVFRDTINSNGIFSSPRVWKRSHAKILTFIGKGRMVKKGVKGRGDIYDICPTILYALGLPLLEDMDGSILNIFLDEYKEEHKVKYISIKDKERIVIPLSQEEKDNNEDEIKQRLKSLGYL